MVPPASYFNETQRAAALYGIAEHVHAILGDEIWRMTEAVHRGSIDDYLYGLLYQGGANAGINQAFYRQIYQRLQALMEISVPNGHDEASALLREHLVESLSRQVAPLCQRNLLGQIDSIIHHIGQRFGMKEQPHGSKLFRLEIDAAPDPQGGFEEGSVSVDCSRVDRITLPGTLYAEHDRYSVLALLLLMGLCRQLGREGISMEQDHQAFVRVQPGYTPHAVIQADLDMDALIRQLALAQDMPVDAWLDAKLRDAIAASEHRANAFGIPDWLERLDAGGTIRSSRIIGTSSDAQAEIQVSANRERAG